MGIIAKPELDALRAEIARLERRAGVQAVSQTLSVGAMAIDGAIPDGGIARASIHEIAGRGPEVEHCSAAALLVANILSRASGPVLWIVGHRDLFAPALWQAGLSPERVVFAEVGKSILLAMEDGLRISGLAGVVAELSGSLTLTASRRLQLAAEASGVTGFILRRSRAFNDPALDEPSAATTRWRVACVPSRSALSGASSVPGVGRARWQLDLTRCRGGEPQSWLVEACDAENSLDLVPDVADRPHSPRRSRRAAS